MSKLQNPDPIWLDGRGFLLDGGSIYIGAAGTDPETPANRLNLFWDKALTIPAAQPLRTLGGFIVNASNVASVFFAETDYSTTIIDTGGHRIYRPTAFDLGGIAYQPADSDLTAIAALATTTYGRAFLSLANQAALQTLVGIQGAGLQAVATAAQFRANTADKVLDTDGVWAAATSVALTPGATVAVDLAIGINFTLAMGGAYTLGDPTNVKDGQTGKIEILQDATGGRTLGYGANWLFVGATDPILSTAANALDIMYFEGLANGKVFGSLAKGLG